MKIEKIENIAIIRIEDNLLLENHEKFDEILNSIVEEGFEYIVLDFEGIDFIATQCLRSITGTVKKTRDKKGDLVFIKPTERIRQLCKITRLDHVIKISDSEKEIMDEFRKNMEESHD